MTQNTEGLLDRYLNLMARHHELVYVHRGMNTKEFILLESTMMEIWRDLPSHVRALIETATNRAAEVSRVQNRVPDNSTLGRVTSIIENHTKFVLDIVTQRTIKLVQRRLEGDWCIDEEGIDPVFKIVGVENQVPWEPYKNQSREKFLTGHFLKIALPTGVEKPPFEFKWVDKVEVYDEPDPQVSKPDELGGYLRNDSNFDTDLKSGSYVTFKVSEIQDVFLPGGTSDPDEYSEENREEGLLAIFTLVPSKGDLEVDEEAEIVTAAWDNMSDREQHHIIYHHRGMKGRGADKDT